MYCDIKCPTHRPVLAYKVEFNARKSVLSEVGRLSALPKVGNFKNVICREIGCGGCLRRSRSVVVFASAPISRLPRSAFAPYRIYSHYATFLGAVVNIAITVSPRCLPM